MTRPRLLDLFCGAGGAAMGYHLAGFDVVGCDITPQPNYPFTFHQYDAIAAIAEQGHRFDIVHASPPCQDHSIYRNVTGANRGTGELLSRTREALTALGKPWVIENVPGAPMRADYMLCGCQFDLPGLRRRRLFETSFGGEPRKKCHHTGMTVTVAGGGGGGGWAYRRGWRYTQEDKRNAMGIDWMTRRELNQAIPPAYTSHIGTQWLAVAWPDQPVTELEETA